MRKLKSDSEGIRTPNQQNRNLPFYPIELRSLFGRTNIKQYIYEIFILKDKFFRLNGNAKNNTFHNNNNLLLRY